jgi:hypothetical protein
VGAAAAAPITPSSAAAVRDAARLRPAEGGALTRAARTRCGELGGAGARRPATESAVAAGCAWGVDGRPGRGGGEGAAAAAGTAPARKRAPPPTAVATPVPTRLRLLSSPAAIRCGDSGDEGVPTASPGTTTAERQANSSRGRSSPRSADPPRHARRRRRRPGGGTARPGGGTAQIRARRRCSRRRSVAAETHRSGDHSLDNNPRVLAGQALHPKYKCIL